MYGDRYDTWLYILKEVFIIKPNDIDGLFIEQWRTNALALALKNPAP